FRFPLGNERGVFDGFQVTRGGDVVPTTIKDGVASWSEELKPNEARSFEVSYRSRGTTRWGYQLLGAGSTGEVKDFKLALDTDFSQTDSPAGTLSPSQQHGDGKSWHGEWNFRSLVANAPIGLTLPQKLNPGPLAEKITFFAPVGLLFFYFV